MANFVKQSNSLSRESMEPHPLQIIVQVIMGNELYTF